MKKPIRYIKIENTTNSTSSYPSVYWTENEVINSEGVNVLLGKLPIKLLDSNNSAYYYPEQATDGSKDNAFNFLYSSYVNFVKYDLGEVHEDLEKILIFQSSYGSKYAKVSVSVDNLTWETIFESYETITWYDSPNYYEAVVPNHIDFSTPDTTPPSFDYISDVILEHGSEFDPLHNVVALDDRDGDITNRIILVGSVDTERAGDYLLTYIVSDLSGNMTVKERHITVLAEPIEEPEEPTPVEEPVASVELQKALFSLLSMGDYPVYEVAPKNQKYPYINLRLQSKTNTFTKTNTNRFTFNLYVHSWSQAGSSAQSKIMDNFIHQSLMSEWDIEGFDVDLIDLVFSETLTETDVEDTIFQGIQEFQITISKK